MSMSDHQLKELPVFSTRSIAAKLIPSYRKGRFGLLFQQQVEQESRHIPALAGLTELAAVVATDEIA